MSESLLAIDGLSVLRRVFEANPSTDIPAKVEAALRITLSSFRRAMAETRTTHAVVAMDHGGQNWRHALYPRYKESRKPMPTELRDAIPGFRADVQSMLGLVCVSREGFEADDIVATLFHRWAAAKPGCPCYPLSTDKDVFQLIGYGAVIRNHFANKNKGEIPWFDEAYVLKRYGVRSDQLGDYLALVGDATDDIPGVDGIGEKTAARLINTYGTLEEVLDNADKEKGVVRKNLIEQADQACMSRLLIELKCDVPLGLTWNMLRVLDNPEEEEPFESIG